MNAPLNLINQPLLVMEAASLRLGRRHFGPYTLSVHAGERVAVLGPSGAGKSTLLKLAARELHHSAGHISLLGRDIRHYSLREMSRRRAVLAQTTHVAFGMQTELVVSLGRAALEMDPHLTTIVHSAMQLAHAAHLAGRNMDQLSGGEQARIHLARIFAQLWDIEQGLVMMDEPLAALDPGLQGELLESMQSYAEARGHALLAILHDINQALHGFDRLLLVSDGQLKNQVNADLHALPALQSLYGIQLGSLVTPEGQAVVYHQKTPARPSRASYPSHLNS
ncbi:MAG TPA: ATP-binding cassette domain-containing protein [Methylovorus sp.]|nr:ATP-binding cassette domain-containing protein [Methylovorus sp.]